MTNTVLKNRNILIINDRNSSPYSDEEVLTLLKDGIITQKTLFWRPGFSFPIPLCQIPEFNVVSNEPAPPKIVQQSPPPQITNYTAETSELLNTALKSNIAQQSSNEHPPKICENKNTEMRIGFTGTGFQTLGWCFLASLCMMLIIPAAWGLAALYRWSVRSLSFPNGTKASFVGRGGQVWGYFSIGILLAFIPQQLSKATEDPTISRLVFFGLPILLLPISTAIGLKMTRWFFSNIRLSSGTNLVFKGDFSSFLGWNLLCSLSMYTVVGWAWASVAMFRWICRNIEAGQNQIEFLGSGWGLLWRSFVAILASVLIIPIPWIWLWVIRWITGNILIKQKAQNL